MLSHQVLTRKSIGALASYYGDGADDYYAKEGESMECLFLATRPATRSQDHLANLYRIRNALDLAQ